MCCTIVLQDLLKYLERLIYKELLMHDSTCLALNITMCIVVMVYCCGAIIFHIAVHVLKWMALLWVVVYYVFRVYIVHTNSAWLTIPLETDILTLKVLSFWKFTSYCSLTPLWSGSYLAETTSPIPSHCASFVATSTLIVKGNVWVPMASHSNA